MRKSGAELSCGQPTAFVPGAARNAGSFNATVGAGMRKSGAPANTGADSPEWVTAMELQATGPDSEPPVPQENKGGYRFVSNATVVIFITVLMFIIPSNRRRLKGWVWNKAMEAEPGSDFGERKDHRSGRLLDWKEVQRKLPWNVVLLLGGGFALAKGCEVSGLHLWLGSQMLPLQNLPPWVIAALLCLVISIFTECSSNAGTATLFLPILASMAIMSKLNPLYILIPGTVSNSFAFMLPVATPPNAIIFSYGHLRVTDMVKAGFVLKVIGVVSVTVAINTWGRAMFHLDTFPTWANITDS